MRGTRTTIIRPSYEGLVDGIPAKAISCAYCDARATTIHRALEHGSSPYDVPLCGNHNDGQHEAHPDEELIDLLNS